MNNTEKTYIFDELSEVAKENAIEFYILAQMDGGVDQTREEIIQCMRAPIGEYIFTVDGTHLDL